MTLDTEIGAREAQIAAVRRLGASQRARLAAEMSEDASPVGGAAATSRAQPGEDHVHDSRRGAGAADVVVTNTDGLDSGVTGAAL